MARGDLTEQGRTHPRQIQSPAIRTTTTLAIRLVSRAAWRWCMAGFQRRSPHPQLASDTDCHGFWRLAQPFSRLGCGRLWNPLLPKAVPRGKYPVVRHAVPSDGGDEYSQLLPQFEHVVGIVGVQLSRMQANTGSSMARAASVRGPDLVRAVLSGASKCLWLTLWWRSNRLPYTLSSFLLWWSTLLWVFGASL